MTTIGLRGPSAILIATVVAGGLGYVLTLFAGSTLGPSAYAPFGTLWSMLFFAASVVSGLQQEIARATTPRPAGQRAKATARDFALIAAAVAASVTLLSSIWWSPLVFGRLEIATALAPAVGLAGYAITATIVGLLSGLHQWMPIAVLIVSDGVLRFALGTFVLVLSPDLDVLVWALAGPYIVVPVMAWLLYRQRFVSRGAQDVSLRALSGNVARTLAGSVASGLLVSGLPALIAITEGGHDSALLGALLFAIMLVRAPLVIVVVSLQSFLVVAFRDARRPARLLVMLASGLIAAGAILAAAAALLGPSLLAMFHPDFALPSWALAAVLGSGALIALMVAVGTVAIAEGRHAVYALGWWLASGLTVLVLLLPWDLLSRASAAMLVGPLAGTIMMLAALLTARGSRGCRVPDSG